MESEYSIEWRAVIIKNDGEVQYGSPMTETQARATHEIDREWVGDGDLRDAWLESRSVGDWSKSS